MGTQNWGYSKFGSTFKIFETILYIFSKFEQLKFVSSNLLVPKNVGIQKCEYNEIAKLVRT